MLSTQIMLYKDIQKISDHLTLEIFKCNPYWTETTSKIPN